MSATSSSSSFNGSLQSSAGSFLKIDTYCYFNEPSSSTFIAFYIIIGLTLLPVCTLILCGGFQKWWRKHSTSTATPMSHSEILTYHLVAMELIGICRCILGCYGILTGDGAIIVVCSLASCFIWSGETFIHMLMCVERYLAVVHPVTYMKLRSDKGIRIRNISIGCIWLLNFLGMSLYMLGLLFFYIYTFVLLSCLSLASFFSVSVLCVLIRPGPGEQGKDRVRVDQSKQKAFNTIVAILGVLVARFIGSLIWGLFFVLEVSSKCFVIMSAIWLNLPSSLVLPLLFLYRERKCGKNNL